MRKVLNNQQGVTLLEIMFALGILVLGTYLVVEGINQMESSTKETMVLSTTERQINAIVDNIRTGLSAYQITYDQSSDTEKALLDLEKLPMAWAPGVVVAVADCKNKPGGCPPSRYGYVIKPIPGYRGLYEVTLRMTNKEWTEAYREFKFLATTQ